MLEIRNIGVREIDALTAMRMEVLRCVFSLPEDADLQSLESANREYYLREIPSGGHVACFAEEDGEVVGAGGLCLYDEMPSPDNPTGRCAYLMNVYVRDAHRGKGIGRRIVRWLTGQALSRGISKIYLETTESARPLYEGLGFECMKDMLKLKDHDHTA